MKRFGIFVKWFLYITTGILIVCGINYTLAGVETITVDVFWKILLSAFATTVATVLIHPQEEDGKIKSYIKLALHYVTLCMIMVLLGGWFGWTAFDFGGVLTMMADVGLVYLLAFLSYYIIDYKQADEINKMLKEKYGDGENGKK